VSDETQRRKRPGARALLLTAVVATLVTLAVVALLVNIFERKQESRSAFYRVVELTDDIEDPAVWGKNFPQQYDAYRRTVDQHRTRYGGSEAVPRTPTQAESVDYARQGQLALRGTSPQKR
jgi:nitrite reductase (cytochrome c-552)